MELSYLDPLKQSFSAAADPVRAAYIKKYMKNLFDFYGLGTPEFRRLEKEFIYKYGLPEINDLDGLIRHCWGLPQREYQHFAMEVAEKFVKKVPEEFIGTYEFMLTGKSWWDTVDMIAARLVGVHFRRFPGLVPDYYKKWMGSGNVWLQRTVLIFQLKYKKDTDTTLLSEAIQTLSTSKEFFIRKAIGWALREYSKTDPDWVRSYVENTNMSSFSKKEALKRIERLRN